MRKGVRHVKPKNDPRLRAERPQWVVLLIHGTKRTTHTPSCWD
ncbi:hypothetical protein [Snodgrassella communis]|nr:hypothetical protein [Snodgrassella communis]